MVIAVMEMRWMMLRCYSELLRIPTFKERYEYLRLDGVVGEETSDLIDTLIRYFTILKNGRTFGEKLLFVIMDVILDWMVTRFVERFLFII